MLDEYRWMAINKSNRFTAMENSMSQMPISVTQLWKSCYVMLPPHLNHRYPQEAVRIFKLLVFTLRVWVFLLLSCWCCCANFSIHRLIDDLGICLRHIIIGLRSAKWYYTIRTYDPDERLIFIFFLIIQNAFLLWNTAQDSPSPLPCTWKLYPTLPTPLRRKTCSTTGRSQSMNNFWLGRLGLETAQPYCSISSGYNINTSPPYKKRINMIINNHNISERNNNSVEVNLTEHVSASHWIYRISWFVVSTCFNPSGNFHESIRLIIRLVPNRRWIEQKTDPFC